jgi:hypothetical protein
MEVYEAEANEIAKSFLQHKIDFPECMEALNAALARFVPRMTGQQIARLRIVMLANNEIVMKEMEKRSAGGSHMIG